MMTTTMSNDVKRTTTNYPPLDHNRAVSARPPSFRPSVRPMVVSPFTTAAAAAAAAAAAVVATVAVFATKQSVRGALTEGQRLVAPVLSCDR